VVAGDPEAVAGRSHGPTAFKTLARVRIF
jgi:hypothetical protein